MLELSVIILAFNEQESLRKTVLEIQSLLKPECTNIIISTSHNATPECIKMSKLLSNEFENVSVFFQKKPFVAAAVLEALEIVTTERTIYMSSDSETPPKVIPIMMDKCAEFDWDIVVASRWIEGGSFTGYGKLKYSISWVAQQVCRLLYSRDLTEFTYGFRLYKTDLLRKYNFHEAKHPFFLESFLIPLRCGATVTEVPVNWTPRYESESVVNFLTLVQYLKPLIRVRFMKKEKIENSSDSKSRHSHGE